MGHVWSITYSPDGARVVTASRDATLRVLDARTGEAVRAPLTGHKADVFAAIFSPDGRTLASSGKDGTIRFWNGATGDAAGELAAHAKSVYAIGFSPDGLSLASASEDGKAILWARAGTALDAPWHRRCARSTLPSSRSSDVPAPATRSRSAPTAPDSPPRATTSASASGTRGPATRIVPPLVAHTDVVLSLVFVDDARLVSSSWDGSIRVWDTSRASSTEPPTSRLLGDRLGPIYSIARSAGWPHARVGRVGLRAAPLGSRRRDTEGRGPGTPAPCRERARVQPRQPDARRRLSNGRASPLGSGDRPVRAARRSWATSMQR